MALNMGAKVGILVTVGLLFALGGLVSYVLFPNIVENVINEKLVLSATSEPFKYWKEVPVPIYIQFYFFNITNPMEVWAQKSKPILEELGPYTFRETRHKENITWNANGTVSYLQIKRWYFQPDLTNGSLDDTIITVNVPLVSAATGVKYADVLFKDGISMIINGTHSTIFVWKKIRELLFEGYLDLILQEAQNIGLDVPYDHFGWFYGKNDSSDGLYSIFTGSAGMHNYGYVDQWFGERAMTEYWDGECAKMRGTAGDMWPPFSVERNNITFFVSDICRPITLSYLKDVKVKGVNAYRFWADDQLFDNGKYNADNKCFCGEDYCLPPGGLNISRCQKGAPAVISYPHFLYADSSYTKGIIGMNPNPLAHQMFMDIEPVMGIPINVAARMQINIFVERIPGVPQFDNLTSKTFYPIFWFSETATFSDEMAKQLRLVTKELPHYSTIIAFLLVVIGGIMLIFTLLYVVRHRSKKQSAAQKTKYTSVRLKRPL